MWRSLLIDGVDQGGIDLRERRLVLPFSEYLASRRIAIIPRAKRALLLGLGCGVLAKTLHQMGMDVTAVEIEPEVVACGAQALRPAGGRARGDRGRPRLPRPRPSSATT